MKKLFLFFALLMPMMASAQNIETIEIDGIYYQFSKSTATVVSSTGASYSGNVVIPDYVYYYSYNYPVRGIGNYAFGKCSNLTSVVIPNTLSGIGEGAFYACTSLTSIEIPSSVSHIGDKAFQDCSSLTKVVVHQKTPLPITSETFTSRKEATLYIPFGCKKAYDTADYWTDFKDIFEMDPQCATPTIEFDRDSGKLSFSCETEDVKFVSTISPTREQTFSDQTVLLTDMTTVYRVSVYATKEGYENSDVATMYIEFKAKKGDVNNDGQITISDAVGIVNIILGNGLTGAKK